MTQKLLRWGILGAANIARKNWASILNSGNGELVAVGGRSAERTNAFIRECQASAALPTAPRACTYDELVAAKDVDAVYVPIPTGIRKEWVVKLAEAGKHVMCEKPCAGNAADLKVMIDACRKNNVQFMDGVMFMHSSRLPKLRAALDAGEIGDLRRISSQFSFFASPEFHAGNIRTSSELEPLGALGDLGWYNIRLTLWTMKYQLPHSVSGRLLAGGGQPGDKGQVPLEFSAELFFKDGVSASFYCSFLAENAQWGVISGTKGYIRINDFVMPFFGGEAGFDIVTASLTNRCCDMDMHERKRRVSAFEYSNNGPDAQETMLFRNFADIVLSGKRDDHWPTIALQTQQVLDACLASARNEGKLTAL